MKRIQQEREMRGWSKLRLSQEARVAPGYIGMAEAGRRMLYPPEAERVAAALGWEHDPMALLDEVEINACD